MHGDTKQSLSPSCHDQIEAEANYGAGRLLFLQDRFLEFIEPKRLSLAEMKGLARTFGNSITSTLWRVVENLEVPAVGFICGHPKRPAIGFDPIKPCDYMIWSRQFASRFDSVSELAIFRKIQQYCSSVSRGPLGSDEVVLQDSTGSEHVFGFETFHKAIGRF